MTTASRPLAKASSGAKEGLGVSKARKSSGARKNSSVRKRKKEDSPDEQTLQCATVALTRWNKNQKSTGAPQYVFVEPVTSVYFWDADSHWFHANFKARPKDDPAAEAELFFVEVKGNVYGTRKREITKLCVLGPTDTGLHGCKACDINLPPPLHHPEGGFNVGHRMGPLLD